MAKINLLTIHWGNCYGAVLQTYATCKILNKLGHDVTLIDFVHPKAKKKYDSISKISQIPIDISFDCFIKKNITKRTKKMYQIDSDLIPQADYTIIGSDQVWNRDITTTHSLRYFLDFVPYNTKRIALSSSFGKCEWDEDQCYTSTVKEQLDKFSAISVRENSGVCICKDVFSVNSIQLADPTLALNDFSELISKRKPYNEIFTFLFRNNKEDKQIVSFISQNLRLPIHKETFFSARFNSSPADWLQKIYYSKFIITSSFHGLALSLIFNKPFVVLCANKSKFTRLLSLLELVGLQERYVPSLEYLTNNSQLITKPIDYEKINLILKKESNKFSDFLKENII